MKFDDFRKLESMLTTMDSAKKVSEKTGWPQDTLRSIYCNKVMRNTIKMYNIVKNNRKKLLYRWESGEHIVTIANNYNFSPVMMARIIFEAWGWKKKRINDILKNPELCREVRLKNEVIEAINVDVGYSPEANQIQSENGINIEDRVKDYLDKNNIKYLRQEDLKEKYQKTPDFLLEEPVEIDGLKVKWIECKANFGGWFELNRVCRKQLKPYIEMFGEGMLVHWLGYIEDYKGFVEGVIVKDRTYFTDKENQQ